MRSFSSKGAYLVLLWTVLICTVSSSLFYSVSIAVRHSDPLKSVTIVSVLLALFVSAPLSGWLADAKFGNYKVFRAGAVLSFISMVINCYFLVLEALISDSIHVLNWLYLCLGSSLLVAGLSTCLATALPLGLDQMPDASSSSITSYIAWFVCSILSGYFVGYILNQLNRFCLELSHFSLVWALFSTLCMTFVLISNFLYIPKWLIIEPKSPQSLKTIYRVLKFAAKHKAPLNRSALTYWEEDIPFRIDLGKAKYGGPFTTEQVEDVKTVLRLLATSMMFSLLVFTSTFQIISSNTTNISLGSTPCLANVSHIFTSKYTGYSIFGVVANEFVIYPLVGHKFPSILKRIGAVSLMTTLVNLVSLILKLAHYLSPSSVTATEWIFLISYHSLGGLLLQMLLTSIVEFLSAQSPYNMRGLLVSFILSLIVLSAMAGLAIGLFHSQKLCSQLWCPLVLLSVKTVLCLLGFLTFCVAAHWYKGRIRDDDSPQRVVEEVSDRYLTAAAAQST